VARARRSITVASFLFWYLLTELGDDTFGPRASIVQVKDKGRAGGLAGWLAAWLPGCSTAAWASCRPVDLVSPHLPPVLLLPPACLLYLSASACP
jgi:hypothetical protein